MTVSAFLDLDYPNRLGFSCLDFFLFEFFFVWTFFLFGLFGLFDFQIFQKSEKRSIRTANSLDTIFEDQE